MTVVGRNSYSGTDLVSAPTADIGSDKGFQDVASWGVKQLLTRSMGGLVRTRGRLSAPQECNTNPRMDSPHRRNRQESAGGSLTPVREHDSLGGPIPTLLFGMPQIDTA